MLFWWVLVRLTLYTDDSQQMQQFDGPTAQENDDYGVQTVVTLFSFHSDNFLNACEPWKPWALK